MSSHLPPSSSQPVPAQKRKRLHRSRDVNPPTASFAVVSPQLAVSGGGPISAVSYPSDAYTSAPLKKKTRTTQHKHALSSDTEAAPVPGDVAYSQLPPVTISHPAGEATRTVHRQLSYGQLAADYVAAVAAMAPAASAPVLPGPHPMDTDMHDVGSGSESSGSSSTRSSSYESESGSYSSDAEEAPGIPAINMSAQVALAPVSIPSAGVALSPRVSSRSKTKTEKGLYVDTLVQQGMVSELAVSDNVKADPSVAHSSVRRKSTRSRRADTIPAPEPVTDSFAPSGVHGGSVVAGTAVVSSPPPAATVYLEDLTGPPMVPARRGRPKQRKSKMSRPEGAPTGQLRIQADFASLEPGADASTPFKTLVVSSDVPAPSSSMKLRLSNTGAVAGHSHAPAFNPVGRGQGSNVVSSGAVPSPGVANVAHIVPVPDAHAGAVKPAVPGAPTAPVISSTLLDDLDALIGSIYRLSSPEVEEDDAGLSPDAAAGTAATQDPDDSDPWNSTDEPEDEALQVMLPEIQEEHLRLHYALLATLGPFRPIVAYGHTRDSFVQPAFLTLETIATLFNKDAHRSIIAWHKFAGYAPYCNLSTMPRSLFTNDGLKMLYSNRACVSMTAGVIMDSFVVKVGQKGGWKGDTSRHGGNRMHGVRLLPFHQPWRRETTVICATFDVKCGQSTYMREDGVEFVTRQFSATSPTNKNKHPSPAVGSAPVGTSQSASSSQTAWPRSPTKSSALVSLKNDYYHCLGFNDDVPIFDGRGTQGPHFLFRNDDFDKLATLLRYQPGKDLDRFTLVAVGHTPSVWAPDLNHPPRITLNVQFVVMLGQAPKPAALAVLGFGVE